jgi:hypothetical protein
MGCSHELDVWVEPAQQPSDDRLSKCLKVRKGQGASVAEYGVVLLSEEVDKNLNRWAFLPPAQVPWQRATGQIFGAFHKSVVSSGLRKSADFCSLIGSASPLPAQWFEPETAALGTMLDGRAMRSVESVSLVELHSAALI